MPNSRTASPKQVREFGIRCRAARGSRPGALRAERAASAARSACSSCRSRSARCLPGLCPALARPGRSVPRHPVPPGCPSRHRCHHPVPPHPACRSRQEQARRVRPEPRRPVRAPPVRPVPLVRVRPVWVRLVRVPPVPELPVPELPVCPVPVRPEREPQERLARVRQVPVRQVRPSQARLRRCPRTCMSRSAQRRPRSRSCASCVAPSRLDISPRSGTCVLEHQTPNSSPARHNARKRPVLLLLCGRGPAPTASAFPCAAVERAPFGVVAEHDPAATPNDSGSLRPMPPDRRQEARLPGAPCGGRQRIRRAVRTALAGYLAAGTRTAASGPVCRAGPPRRSRP